tara:strand:- start:1539 stop:2066 length:528 start_codon:yes stop_codon:yes gene_type:complete
MTTLFVLALMAEQAVAKRCTELHSMNAKQINIMVQSYILGEKQDLGYTLSAIAWKESQAGSYPINISDPSFGVHHILITSAIKRSGLKDTSFNRNRLAAKLLEHKVSSMYAIQELKFWQRKYENDWIKVWASYNAGYSWQNGLKYANDIKQRIQLIKLCLIPKSKSKFESKGREM